ncbi:hypothetical protein [Janthinobacterium sp. LB3P112]|uniref:hypothetical protein n=1 Tax=Janthinobacterium sp. LB3P112 TaxID=3424196 RepID=UPI003F24FEE2
MTIELKDLLKSSNVRRALIVDDAYDPIPLAPDLADDSAEWSQFFDDLKPADRKALAEGYPEYSSIDGQVLSTRDSFVKFLWEHRSTIGAAQCATLFARYEKDIAEDLRLLGNLEQHLTEFELPFERKGREFEAHAHDVDLIFIDLFFSSAQSSNDVELSINKLANVIEKRRERPPLVVLMSRSSRLHGKRAEFQERTKLFDSAFRVLQKSELMDVGVVARSVQRLASHYADSLKLSTFVHAWENGLTAARDRTTKLIRKLGLTEIAQIKHLLLSVEGEPTGSYLVDVFEKVLQHEIEGEAAIIDAALALNEMTSDEYPPPFVPGANDLLDLAQRALFQNRARLKLPGSIGSNVAFGDVILRKPNVAIQADAPPLTTSPDLAAGPQAEPAQASHNQLLGDIEADNVLAILTPACDLQRNGARKVILQVGKLMPLEEEKWTYKDTGPRTPVFDLPNGQRKWIKWNVKHVEALNHEQLDLLTKNHGATFEIIARLRESHALEIQQKLLASMGRIGLIAPMPATFHMQVEAFYYDANGKFTKLDMPDLGDGGVCYVGRSEDPDKPVERLTLTDNACEALCKAISEIDISLVNDRAREQVARLKTSIELFDVLGRGIPLPNVSQGFKEIVSKSDNVSGLIYRNKIEPETHLKSAFRPNAGVVLSVFKKSEVVAEPPAEAKKQNETTHE